MGEWLGWVIVLLLIVIAIWSFSRENERRRRRTAQEYERDVAESHNTLMRAGLVELDKIVGDSGSKRAAVEYLKDEKQGQTRTGGNDDDESRTEGEELP